MPTEFKIFGSNSDFVTKLLTILKWLVLGWVLCAAIALFGTYGGRIGQPPPSDLVIHRNWGIFFAGCIAWSVLVAKNLIFLQLFGYYSYGGSEFQYFFRAGKTQFAFGKKRPMDRLERVFRDPFGSLVFIFNLDYRKVQIWFRYQTDREIESIITTINSSLKNPLDVERRDKLSAFILRNIDPNMDKPRRRFGLFSRKR